MKESEIVAKFVADINALNGSSLTEADVQALINKKLGRNPIYVVQFDTTGDYLTGSYRSVKSLGKARVFRQKYWADHFAKRLGYKGGATVKEVTLTLV